MSEPDQSDRSSRDAGELTRALERQIDELNTFYAVVARINAGMSLAEVLDQVYDSFRSFLPYDRIGVATIEDGGRMVRAQCARSAAAEVRLKAGYAAPLAGSSLNQILASGKPRILNDLPAYAERTGSASTRLIVDEGMRSSLTCPLTARGKAVGFIFFSSMAVGTYDDAHIDRFQHLAGQLSIIVEKVLLYEQLVELNETKNRFLGVAAHDLRSPLGVVRGFLRLMRRGVYGEQSAESVAMLERLDGVCNKMLDLVSDFLDVSTIESGHLELELEPTDLVGYLRGQHQEYQVLAADKSIAVNLELDAELPGVAVDLQRLDQIISNLVGNAIKFSEPGTEITLGARSASAHVEVFVRDQGQGIPDTEIGGLFVGGPASVRPTAGERSTGLGLAIVKRLVEAHGGTITVTSAEGRGTVMSFTLPI